MKTMPELIKKIDLHVHVVPEKDLPKPSGDNYPTPEELRPMYDRMNIEGGILLPQGSAPEGTCDRLSQREAYNMVKSHPHVFVGWFCNVDPRQGKNSGETDFGYYLRYYKEKGACGIGEMTAPLPIDDPRMQALFKAAEAYQMPVLMHFGAPGSDYGIRDELHFPQLEKALQKYPNLIFIGHSAIFWAELGGDCSYAAWAKNPTGKVAPGGAVPRLMEKYPNLHCEFSSLAGANGLLRDPEFTWAFLEKYADRIYYGTDFHDPRNLETYDAYKKVADFLEEGRLSGKLSEENYRKICRENALKLLGRK